MKKLKQILNEAASLELKVGDTIRTKLGGQIPGIVTKIEGQQVYFNHLTAKYQTVWSGAKDKPKQYVAHISNVVKESYKKVSEAFSKSHLDALKTAYSDLERMDPTSHAYKKLITLLNSLPQDKLKSLADANIKFVSVLAKNRIKKPVAEEDRCWSGYKPTPGVKAYEKGSCMKEQEDIEEEAEHDGKKVTLNKPFRTPGQDKKFAVYVRNDKGNVIKLGFGDPNMEIKRDDPERRKNYRARHNCADPGPKWKANYWSCKMWADKPVSDIVETVGDKYFVSWAEPEKTFLKRAGMKFPLHKEFSSAAEVDSYLSKWLMKDPQDSINVDAVKNFYPTREPGKNEYGVSVIDTKDKQIYRSADAGFKKTHKLKDIVVEINGTKRLIGNVVRKIKTDGNDEVVVESAPPDPKIERWILANKERFKKEYGAEKGLEVLYAKAWDMYNKK